VDGRERRRVTIRGLVQGVFFRETVRRIALAYEVSGFVRNVELDCVEVEAEGERAVLEAFIEHVLNNPPPRARVDRVHAVAAPPTGETGFSVAPTVR
jgi:hydrogenase maturation protein HypF